ncbi:MAG: DUF1549 domain-containing protein [Verrucomicrobia bacterium]|nr:DUF1549 domain-containing protein [Verrucomicrobiota bacterium]
MKRLCTRVWLAAFGASALTGAASAANAPKTPVDFSHQIVPILREHCGECHTGDKKKGSLSMNTRADLLKGGESGAVLEPGKSAKSKFIEVLITKDDDAKMPPKGPRLSREKVELLRAWIDGGAQWDDGFAFKKPAYEPPLKPRRPELPRVVRGRTNAVDRILDAHLARTKVKTPVAIGDGEFARRVHLDIIGLLPEPAALEKFLTDKSKDKRATLVRELLDRNVDYAEHWLSFWNDLLRNDYAGTGYVDGGRKQITKWLYASLVANEPFDRFVRDLIAPNADSEGFSRGIKWRGSASAGQAVEVQFAQAVGQTFLGINLKCASCHDSFIDRWKLDEAYRLAAIISEAPLEVHRCDKPSGRIAKPGWLFPELGDVDAAQPPAERLKQLAALMTHPDNGRVPRTIVNRLWHRLMGRGIVHPVDAMQTEPWSVDLLDFLAVQLADQKFDLKKIIELICTSQAYQSRAQVVAKDTDDHGYKYAGPRAKRMTAEQFLDAVWQITGTAPAKPEAPSVRGQPDPAPKAAAAKKADVAKKTADAKKAEPAKKAEVVKKVPPVKPVPQPMVRASLMKADLLQRTLGRPNREQIVTSRPTDLSTLTALDLNNGQLLADLLARGAAKITKERGDSSDALVKWLYLQAFARAPSKNELAVATEALGSKPTEQGVQDLLWAVVMTPEFQIVR